MMVIHELIQYNLQLLLGNGDFSAWDITKPHTKCYTQQQIDRILLAQGTMLPIKDILMGY